MNRYRVSYSKARDAVGIYDREMRAYCGLPPARDQEPQVLRWTFSGDVHGSEAGDAYSAAEDWLEHCYKAWGIIPKVGEPHPAEVGWERVYAVRAAQVADRHFRPNGPSTVPNC